MGLGRVFAIRLLLWLALSALPMVAIAHAFDHPIATPDGHGHVCLICAHGHNGSGPSSSHSVLPAAVPLAAVLVSWRLPLAVMLAPIRLYAVRAPPAHSFD